MRLALRSFDLAARLADRLVDPHRLDLTLTAIGGRVAKAMRDWASWKVASSHKIADCR